MGIIESEKALKFVNLISGGGSTNLAILEAERHGGMLEGLTKTVAIISSDPKALGIQRAIDAGFPAGRVFSVKTEKDGWPEDLLELLDMSKPDYFHQLGWMPLMPAEVLERYKGLNQHFGPGGKGMYGVRRVYAHQRFCQLVGEERPIPIFCQEVAKEYDAGRIIQLRWEDVSMNENVEEAAERILRTEHLVQIEARAMLATGGVKFQEVPRIALNKKEDALLLQAKEEAMHKYPAPQRQITPPNL